MYWYGETPYWEVPHTILNGDDIVYAPNKYRETEGTNRDKAKGIVCKPMPRDWHDKHAVNKIESTAQRDFFRSIVASRKPYFMRYIYPALMKEYNTYIKNTMKNCLREFGLTVEDLMQIPEDELTDRQSEFIRYYKYRMPVGTNDCIMNKICRRFEQEFDGYMRRFNASSDFDYTFMLSDAEYTERQKREVKQLYDDYNKRIKSYSIFSKYERINEFDSFIALSDMNDDFRRGCDEICPDKRALCNIILDICYQRSSTKRFAWNMCGEEIIHNLLEKNNYTYHYPTLDPGGDIEFGGKRFREEEVRIEVAE